jgi:DNA-binding transcriptional LysR family regulator
MTLRQLEVFLAVAREKSFSLAAKKIHSSQPTLSEHISEARKRTGKAAVLP